MNKELSQEYHDYLKSPEWQKRKSQRLMLDQYKCQRCGSPLNLDVHHLTYERFKHQDVQKDLLTLCRSCHTYIEAQKDQYGQQFTVASFMEQIRKDEERRQQRKKQEQIRNNYRKLVQDHVDDFINVCWPYDYGMNGRYDFCNYAEIQESFERYMLKTYGADIKEYYLTPSLQIQNKFKKKRVFRIAELKKKGMTFDQVCACTHLSKKFIEQHY